MGAAAKGLEQQESCISTSEEMLQFIDHLAELLAEEYAASLREV